MDAAYDARDLYVMVEDHGAQPIIKPRPHAKTTTLDARGRAIRTRLRHPVRWQRAYNRRPITESANYALKRRFGDRLWAHGLPNQQREMALRILVHNSIMKCRWNVRVRIRKGEL